MSMLIANEGYSLTQQNIEAQLNHERSMALGNNSIPFRYGHFTDDTKYDLNGKLIHKDSFGYYFHNPNSEIIEKYPEAVFSIDKKNVMSNVDSSTDVSFMVARLATLGGKDISNALPFNLEHIVGSHNGTVAGLEQDGKSDSRYIMGVLDKYFSGNSSEIDVGDLEQTFIKQIVNPSQDYSAMNLIVHVKASDKVIVLCSYNEGKVKSIQHGQYYTMVIASNESGVYISSEDDFGEVMGNNSDKIYTQNHTLYVIDKKTGEIKEYHLSDLEEAIHQKSEKSPEKSSEEEGVEGEQVSEGDSEEQSFEEAA